MLTDDDVKAGCRVETLTQFECVLARPAAGTAPDAKAWASARSVCMPVVRFFKRCPGKANVELTALLSAELVFPERARFEKEVDSLQQQQPVVIVRVPNMD